MSVLIISGHSILGPKMKTFIFFKVEIIFINLSKGGTEPHDPLNWQSGWDHMDYELGKDFLISY